MSEKYRQAHATFEKHRPELRVLLALVGQRDDIFIDVDAAELSALDWRWLVDACGDHKLIGPLFEKLEGRWTQVPSWIRPALWVRLRENKETARCHIDELIALTPVLEAADMPYRLVRGPVLSQLIYGMPDQREFCDLDVQVKKGDFDMARLVFENAGYRSAISEAKVFDDRALQMGHPGKGIGLDLHWSEVPRWLPLGSTMHIMRREAAMVDIEGTPVPTVPPEETLLLLCVQCIKDGWRDLDKWHDLTVLLQSWSDLDWTLITSTARRAGYHRSLLLTLRLLGDGARSALPASILQAADNDRGLARAERLIHTQLALGREEYAKWAQRQPKHGFIIYLSSIHFPIAMWCLVTDDLRQSLRVWLWISKFLLSPKPADLAAVPLPNGMRWAYYITRPFRLLFKTLLPAGREPKHRVEKP